MRDSLPQTMEQDKTAIDGTGGEDPGMANPFLQRSGKGGVTADARP